MRHEQAENGVVRPGEILRDLMSRCDSVTQDELAKRIGVSRYSVNQLVNDKRSVTAEMALRLAKAFSTSAEFWLNIQMALDLHEARRRLSLEIEAIEPVRKPIPDEELFYRVGE